MKTKGELVIDTYSMMRVSGMTADPTPEELELALNRQEAMAQMWASRNVNPAFNFEELPDPDSPSGVPAQYELAYTSNLAAFFLPDFAKAIPVSLIGIAKGSFSNLSARVFQVCENQYPSRQPRGSGNTQRWSRYLNFYNGYNVPVDCSNGDALATYRKDPDIDFDYAIDWTGFIPAADFITAAEGFIVDDRDFDSTNTDELKVDSVTFTTKGTETFLTDGLIGAPGDTRTYRVTTRITTDGGLTNDRSVYIRMVEK